MYFKINPTKFDRDEIKIDVIASYFEGDTERWFRPYLKDYLENSEDVQEEDTKDIFTSYAKFKRHIKLAFEGQDEVREAEKRILTLRQTKSVREYALQIRGLIATLGWSDEATVPIFRKGLMPSIRQEIRKETLKKLSKLIEKAIEADNAI